MEVHIQHISDVLPFLREDSGIIVSERPDHSVIDYVYTTDGMWDSDMALQCRGLKFDADGKIIGRPFHKFFNVGEREAPQDIAWHKPHVVLDKLDGSMVHPVLLNSDLVFMTRMGAMAQAKTAQTHASAGILDLCHYCVDAELTPIFEFTDPNHRIVIAYEQPRLTLLAVREFVSGRYLPHAELEALSERFDVPLVGAFGSVSEFQDFIDKAREEIDIEGYVVAFEDGHRVKLKTRHYALRHKALSNVTLEKNVLEWVVDGAIDDVLPLLSPEIAAKLQAYHDRVQAAVSERTREVIAFANAHRDLPRADFAKRAKIELDPRIIGAAFAILDDRSPRDFLMTGLQRAAGSINRIDAIRDLYGFEWTLAGIATPEA